MKYNKILALTPALLLAACGGSEQTVNDPVLPGSTIYSYPADGQSEVSPKADIILRFSHAITDEELTSKIQISDGTSNVPFTVTPVDGGRSLRLSPVGQLQTGTDYTITFEGNLLAESNRSVPTPNAIGANGIQFSTRSAMTGIAELDNLSSTFAVANMIPSADGFFKPMDFSTFRLQLTQPAHPEWQQRGGSITLRDAAGDSVPATVLVDGRHITIDPCTTEDKTQCGLEGDALIPGSSYSIEISGLQNLAGETLDYSASFTPKDTSPTVILFQDTIDSGLLAGLSEADAQRSVLNGEIINGVTLNSVLQGIAGPSQQTGGLYAELAYAPSFPGAEPVPLRVPKGSLLTSSSLDVLVNGTVPIINPETNSVQTTGEIKVTMLSDATGYLYLNPYSDSGEAPRHVKLFMDVSMNTEEAQPNASLSQDLLGVELSGIAIVKDGVLTIDAIGMVEPNLLGQEFTDSTIAFRIEADTNIDVQLNALDNRTTDTTGPQLLSWMPGSDEALPGNRDQMQRPGDPIILNFDEALDGDSLANAFTLFANDVEVPNLRSQLDGTVVVLNPAGGLQLGTDYKLNISNTLTDLVGNAVLPQTLEFNLPDATSTSISPIAVTTYPGFPCVTIGHNLANDSHGFCLDKPAADDGNNPSSARGDELPVTELPANRGIVVVFSQPMNTDSIVLGDTFLVETVDDGGSSTGAVSGRLEKNVNRIRFYPDQPWTEGQAYRYTLVSQLAGSCANSICAQSGAPLQTDALVNALDAGGPPMEIYFRGGEVVGSVYTPLRNLPARDVNANYAIDADEPSAFPAGTADDGGFKPSENAAKLRTNGQPFILTSDGQSNVGCEVGLSCPEKKFIYQTGGLNTEVVGPVDPDDPSKGIRVFLYPTMLIATSIDVYLDGDAAADLILPPDQPQVTGPQMLRMRYADLDGDGNRTDLIPGVIKPSVNGPVFSTSADLALDAPGLELPMANLLEHNLFSYAITLELEGPVTFFDDGRMQINQFNSNEANLDVVVEITDPALSGTVDFLACLLNPIDCIASGGAGEEGAVVIPLRIPPNGVYLSFLGNPIKEIPEQY